MSRPVIFIRFCMGRVVPLCVYWIDARLIFCKSKDIFPDVRAANSAGRIELSRGGHGITHTVRLTRKHAPHHQALQSLYNNTN